MKAEPPYPDKFKAGDIAVSLIHVQFTNGSIHNVGDEILVHEDTKSYYNVWHQYYNHKVNANIPED